VPIAVVRIQESQERLGLLEWDGVEAFGEPGVDWGKHGAGLVSFSCVVQQSRLARRRLQFP
jgi:hypothetical protein